MENFQLIENRISMPCERPLKILHITDVHLTGADERDKPEKRSLSEARHHSFAARMGENYEAYFWQWLQWGKGNCDIVINTGDVMDFTSEVLFEKLKKAADTSGSRAQMLFATGNHEFSQYLGEAKEDLAYKMKNYNRVQNCIPNSLEFCAREIGGIIFVTLDDSYYDFTERQYYMLKREIEKGKPIVLCMHTPIYHPEMVAFAQQGNPGVDAGVVGAPLRVTSRYSPERAEQQKTNRITGRMVKLIEDSPSIRLILAGHCHFNYTCRFKNGLTQYVTDLACRTMRLITITPDSTAPEFG